MTPGTALAALLADLSDAFAQPGDQTALVLSEDASTGRVVVVVLVGPEAGAVIAADTPAPKRRGAAA